MADQAKFDSKITKEIVEARYRSIFINIADIKIDDIISGIQRMKQLETESNVCRSKQLDDKLRKIKCKLDAYLETAE